VPVRGKRNEPAFLVHTAACLAAALGVESAMLNQHATLNAEKLFGLPATSV
jgi:TatD DNase family protein